MQFLIQKSEIHKSDTNEVTRGIVYADLKVFLAPFSGEMVDITLNTNHVSHIHKKKPFFFKFEVNFVSLV